MTTLRERLAIVARMLLVDYRHQHASDNPSCRSLAGECPADFARVFLDALDEVALLRREAIQVLSPEAIEALEEVNSARVNWPSFNSAHEAFAVLAEEVDELWDHVRVNQQRRDLPSMRREAVQVAAMALRFAGEVCDEERGRK